MNNTANESKKVEMMEFKRALADLQAEVRNTVSRVFGMGVDVQVIEQPKSDPMDMEVMLQVVCTGFKSNYPSAIKEFGEAMEKVAELVDNFKYNGYRKYYGEETLEFMKYQY